MTEQIYTPEQILASFSKGFKSARLKAMAQEIAGLANENAALKAQLAQKQGHQPRNVTGHLTKAQELSLATDEAQKILADAHASAFQEAIKGWQDAQARWQQAKESGQFIPSPIFTASFEIKEALQVVGYFDPQTYTLQLGDDYSEGSMSGDKKLAMEGLAEVLGKPEPGESITRVLDVALVAARTAPKGEEPEGKHVLGFYEGYFVGGMTASHAKTLAPFVEALAGLGIQTSCRVEITLSATKARGTLGMKTKLGVPDKHAIRDSLNKIYKAARIMNSAYAQSTVTTPEAQEKISQVLEARKEITDDLQRMRELYEERKALAMQNLR